MKNVCAAAIGTLALALAVAAFAADSSGKGRTFSEEKQRVQAMVAQRLLRLRIAPQGAAQKQLLERFAALEECVRKSGSKDDLKACHRQMGAGR